ncbi:MAG: uridine kinase [Gemmatimonadota bacterium]|nr:uridine kinase [Gemmatimonadota bacterium]
MKPLIVGIAGGSGSGKSTVARTIAERLSAVTVALLDMDAYYRDFERLSLEERAAVNWDHPEAFDLDLFATQLRRLADGFPVEKPSYDFIAHRRSADTTPVQPPALLVTEGILLFVDARVRELCDIKIFVDTDADIRLVRRLRRDMRWRGRTLKTILEQYLRTVRPMHLEFVEPSKRHADAIVSCGGDNDDAIEMIIARIERRLEAPGK